MDTTDSDGCKTCCFFASPHGAEQWGKLLGLATDTNSFTGAIMRDLALSRQQAAQTQSDFYRGILKIMWVLVIGGIALIGLSLAGAFKQSVVYKTPQAEILLEPSSLGK